MKRGHWERPPAWLVLGLALVLLSGPIGNWYNFVTQTLETLIVSGYDFHTSDGADRFPGWLALIAGWCCIAHALGGARKPPSDLPAGFARLRFRLRWLPVPMLATLGSYIVLAYHSTPPLILRIDIENAPPGLTLHGGVIVGRATRHESHYRATIDALFSVPLPPIEVKASFYDELHSEYRFAAGRLSLQNLQPNLERVFVGIEDEIQGKSAFVALVLHPRFEHTEGTIRVTRESLKQCFTSEYPSGGACRIQEISRPLEDREIRVVFDLAGIGLEPYKDEPFYSIDRVN
jgi:hypothetical protein